MATNYLDKTGLGTLWGKIKALSNVVVVHLTSYSTGGTTTYTSDKTYAELRAASAGGKLIVMFYAGTCYVVSFGPITLASTSSFEFIRYHTTLHKPHMFVMSSDGTFTTKTENNVRTVNGQDGAVTLTYSDVGALPDSTVIPTKVSDLNNDANYQTQAQVNALIAAADVDDTTYAISISGNVITLTGSDGNTSTVTLPVYTGGVV